MDTADDRDHVGEWAVVRGDGDGAEGHLGAGSADSILLVGLETHRVQKEGLDLLVALPSKLHHAGRERGGFMEVYSDFDNSGDVG